MIESIKMQDCATYPSTGVIINNCSKINFFYGPNGSGKSTISNYLYEPINPMYSSCEISWENNQPVDIIVYNKEFRNRHFKEDIDGVFTLGEATIEEIEKLKLLKKKREERNNEILNLKRSLGQIENELKRNKDNIKSHIWNAILKRNENDFKEVFSGFRSSKEKLYDEVIRRYDELGNNDKKYNTKEQLRKQYELLYSNIPEKYDVIDFDAIELIPEINSIEEDDIWSKVIVGNDDVPVSKLISYLDNADWVNKGRAYLRETGVCPFCQQKTITKGLERQLNDFFSGEYEANIKCLRQLNNRYKELVDRLIVAFKKVENNDVLKIIFDYDITKYQKALYSLELLISKSLNDMSSKELETGKKVHVNKSEGQISELLEIIKNANDAILSHNNVVENYNQEKKKLEDEIWSVLILEQGSMLDDHIREKSRIIKAVNGITAAIEKGNKQLENLEDDILLAGKNVTSVQPAVDEINRALIAYGFTNFRIVPSPTKANSYQIQRLDGSLAVNTLSEGEETFISFLYFLQFAKGSVNAQKISSKKILVLDDPICSLDSTVLYIVSSMVKSLIRDICKGISDVEQIFILTHNVFFHKEASFVDGRTKEMKDVHYWIISKDNNETSIRSFETINPIKTSYELLWQELKTNTNASLITTQNIMRRILENYFGILGKEIDSTIIGSFPSLEEQYICRALISWINDGSHSIPDDFYIDSYTDSVERYKQVFKEIFIKMDHKAHYDMMMG